jgi:hypothetical protein
MDPELPDFIQIAVQDMLQRMQTPAGKQQVFAELMGFSQAEQRMLLPHLMQALQMDTGNVQNLLSSSAAPATVVGRVSAQEAIDLGMTSRQGQLGGQELLLERQVQAFSRNQLIAAGYPQWSLFNELTGGTRSMEDVADLMQLEFNPPAYRDPLLGRPGGGFGSVPFEEYRTNAQGESVLVRKRARTSKGQLGRSLLKERSAIALDLTRAVRAVVLENYRRLIDTDRTRNTGQGEKAIEQGEVRTEEELTFTYRPADLPAEPRPWEQGTPSRRPPVREYLGIVFEGRSSISSSSTMRFMSREGWRQLKSVAPAPPKPVLELTPEQIEKIDQIILKGITEEVREWLQEAESR